MSAPLRSAADRLRSSYRWLQRSTWAACGFALGLAPLALSSSGGLAYGLPFLALLLAYAAAKTRRGLRARRAAKQLRLEEKFLRQRFDEQAWQRCLQERHHLWARCRTLEGLRQAQRQPRLRLRPAEVQQRHMRACYRRAFRSDRPPLLTVDLGLGALLTAGAVALGALASVGAAGVLSALVLLEGVQVALSRALRRDYAHFFDVLARWTLARGPGAHRGGAHQGDGAAPPGPEAAYRHVLLYEASPWFADPAANAPAAQRRVDTARAA